MKPIALPEPPTHPFDNLRPHRQSFNWVGPSQVLHFDLTRKESSYKLMTHTLGILVAFLYQDETILPLPAHTSALGDILHNSGPVAFAVLILLAFASVFSWAIILAKFRSFAAARKQSARFLRAFRKSGRLSEIAAVTEQFRPSPLVAVFSEINDEYQRQTGGRGLPRNPVGMERAAATASSEALTLMESRITWLATIGNIAPFIGLFGTVWGIIDAFHGLGTAGAATLRAVAPGISEALITTAAGILVAIPAVVGYNQLTAQLRDFAARMDDFGRELLNAIENAAAFTPQAPTPEPTEARRRNF